MRPVVLWPSMASDIPVPRMPSKAAPTHPAARLSLFSSLPVATRLTNRVLGSGASGIAAMTDRAIYILGGVSALITLSVLVMMVVVYWRM